MKHRVYSADLITLFTFAVLFGSQPLSAPAQTYNPLDGAAAWPANNHACWVYGSTPTLGGAFTPFLPAYAISGYHTMNAYRYSASAYPANYPIVAFNTGTNEINEGSGQFIVPAGTVDMVPGYYGRYAVARFLVPSSGQYHVNGRFLGLEGPYGSVPATRTDVHVLHNSVGLFSEMVIGQFTEKSFSFVLRLGAGDTLDFAVGYGAGTYGNQDDSTGLFATIVPAPVLSVMPGNPPTLSWPTNAAGFVLESATNLPPAGAWETCAETPVGGGANYMVTNASGAPQRFFRLHLP